MIYTNWRDFLAKCITPSNDYSFKYSVRSPRRSGPYTIFKFRVADGLKNGHSNTVLAHVSVSINRDPNVIPYNRSRVRA